MTDKRSVRTLEQVTEDGLWPTTGLIGIPADSRRHEAMAEVLCSIPNAGYQMLVDHAYEFDWFVPHYYLLGETHPFPPCFTLVLEDGSQHESRQNCETESPRSTDDGFLPNSSRTARVLYLSPRLEKSAWDILVAVVAHELAHIALNHSLLTTPEEYARQEQEVFDTICEWGFGREAKKHNAWCSWRDTMLNKPPKELEQQLNEFEGRA